MATPQPTSSGTAADPVVAIEDVTHHYGSVVALDHISVEIPTGLMVGIIGPDGVGKSTLMALVAGSKRLQGNDDPGRDLWTHPMMELMRSQLRALLEDAWVSGVVGGGGGHERAELRASFAGGAEHVDTLMRR